VAICNRLSDWAILFVTPDRRKEVRTKKKMDGRMDGWMDTQFKVPAEFNTGGFLSRYDIACRFPKLPHGNGRNI
jgi:hypothetical protein